jgi:hypothetical protein
MTYKLLICPRNEFDFIIQKFSVVQMDPQFEASSKILVALLVFLYK